MEGRLTLGHVPARQRIPELGRKRRHGLGGRTLRLRRGLDPGPILRRSRRHGVIKLRDQPSQPIQVVLQAPFGVEVGVVKDTERTAVTARSDLPEDGEVEMTGPQRLDLLALGFAIGVHAVEIQGEQMRQQLR